MVHGSLCLTPVDSSPPDLIKILIQTGGCMVVIWCKTDWCYVLKQVLLHAPLKNWQCHYLEFTHFRAHWFVTQWTQANFSKQSMFLKATWQSQWLSIHFNINVVLGCLCGAVWALVYFEVLAWVFSQVVAHVHCTCVGLTCTYFH